MLIIIPWSVNSQLLSPYVCCGRQQYFTSSRLSDIFSGSNHLKFTPTFPVIPRALTHTSNSLKFCVGSNPVSVCRRATMTCPHPTSLQYVLCARGGGMGGQCQDVRGPTQASRHPQRRRPILVSRSPLLLLRTLLRQPRPSLQVAPHGLPHHTVCRTTRLTVPHSL